MESKHFIQLSKGEVMAMAFPLLSREIEEFLREFLPWKLAGAWGEIQLEWEDAKRWDDRVAIRGMAIKIHRLVADLDGMQLDAEA
jgi:hypothetical protein